MTTSRNHLYTFTEQVERWNAGTAFDPTTQIKTMQKKAADTTQPDARNWLERHVLSDPRRGGKTKLARCPVFGLCVLYEQHTGASCDEAAMHAALIATGFEVRPRLGLWGRCLYTNADEQIAQNAARSAERTRSAAGTTSA